MSAGILRWWRQGRRGGFLSWGCFVCVRPDLCASS